MVVVVQRKHKNPSLSPSTQSGEALESGAWSLTQGWVHVLFVEERCRLWPCWSGLWCALVCKDVAQWPVLVVPACWLSAHSPCTGCELCSAALTPGFISGSFWPSLAVLKLDPFSLYSLSNNLLSSPPPPLLYFYNWTHFSKLPIPPSIHSICLYFPIAEAQHADLPGQSSFIIEINMMSPSHRVSIMCDLSSWTAMTFFY